jgi:tellurite resistance protein TerC
LRALFFVVDDLQNRLVYLNRGLAAILAVISVKFFVSEMIEIPAWMSLAAVALILAVTVVASLRSRRRAQDDSGAAAIREDEHPAPVQSG